jgi:hypothetical protein
MNDGQTAGVDAGRAQRPERIDVGSGQRRAILSAGELRGSENASALFVRGGGQDHQVKTSAALLLPDLLSDLNADARAQRPVATQDFLCWILIHANNQTLSSLFALTVALPASLDADHAVASADAGADACTSTDTRASAAPGGSPDASARADACTSTDACASCGPNSSINLQPRSEHPLA